MIFNHSFLGDIARVGDGAHSKVKRVEDGVMYLTSKNIKKGFLDLEKVDYISKEDHNKLFSKSTSSVRHLEENDILVGIIGTFGNIYQYSDEDFFGISSSIGIVRANKEIINPNYLYYYLGSRYIERYIDNIKGGSVQGYTNLNALRSIPINYPEDIADQVKIVDILKSLDSKIKLNIQMIDTLEEIASTLFQRWFVDFEFPDENGNQYKSSGGKMIASELGDIPEGWKVCCISEIIENSTNKIVTEQLSLENYVSTENLLKNKKGITNAAKLPTQIRVNKFEENDILISNIRPYFKKIWYSDRIGGHSNDVLIFKSNDRISSEFLYLYMREDSFFNFMVSTSKGTKMPRGDKKAIQNKKLVIPSKPIDELFKIKVDCILKQTKVLNKENRELGILRDYLLPKLLTGQIKI